MRKVILFMLCLFVGTQVGYSQEDKLSPEELSYRNSIEQFLKEEGYIPTIDDDDNSLNFKKEGNRYWLTVAGSNPYYIRLHESGFTMEGTNQKVMLDACNYANMNKRCAKAFIDSKSVCFVVEFYSHSIEGFKYAFYDNMRVVDAVKKATKDYYNEHK